jgi:hypothetical protein
MLMWLVIRLLGGRLATTAALQLSLLDHVHQFDAAWQDARTPEGLNPSMLHQSAHRSRRA